MTGVAIYFHNIPGAMMRVLNCFTRRGLVLQAVWCAPVEESYRATVLVEASTSTIDQTVRELESTVGVDSVELLEKPRADQLAQSRAPEVVTGENGSTVIKVAGPPDENRFLLKWLGSPSL